MGVASGSEAFAHAFMLFERGASARWERRALADVDLRCGIGLKRSRRLLLLDFECV